MAKPDKAGGHGKHEETIVKRVSHKDHDDGHGGAWKVAFADFCLALMCLFLVMWLMAAREQTKTKEVSLSTGGSLIDEGQGHMTETSGEARGSLIEQNLISRPGRGGAESRAMPTMSASSAATVGSPTHNRRTHYESPRDLQTLSEVLAELSAGLGLSSNLQTVITAYGLRVMVHDTDKVGMFERGSAVPTRRFRELLAKMGPLFARMDNQMLIIGHTDAVQFTDRRFGAYSNWALSSSRALTARTLLGEGGMSSEGILQVVGMADRAPIDKDNATAGVNRRIELVVLATPQARAIAAMFGTPEGVQPLTDSVDTALPERSALQAIRTRLLPTPEGAMRDN